ncbi:hypothetical protein ACFLYB_04330 [Chloroflexota bacterium]
MPEYCLDIETSPKKERPDFGEDEILTIQYQLIDIRTGKIRVI